MWIYFEDQKKMFFTFNQLYMRAQLFHALPVDLYPSWGWQQKKTEPHQLNTIKHTNQFIEGIFSLFWYYFVQLFWTPDFSFNLDFSQILSNFRACSHSTGQIRQNSDLYRQFTKKLNVIVKLNNVHKLSGLQKRFTSPRVFSLIVSEVNLF